MEVAQWRAPQRGQSVDERIGPRTTSWSEWGRPRHRRQHWRNASDLALRLEAADRRGTEQVLKKIQKKKTRGVIQPAVLEVHRVALRCDATPRIFSGGVYGGGYRRRPLAGSGDLSMQAALFKLLTVLVIGPSLIAMACLLVRRSSTWSEAMLRRFQFWEVL